MNILIVDDSPIIRTMLRRCVGLSGLQVKSVREAPDGEAAWDAFQEEPAEIIMCDIHMPRLDGIGFIQRLAQNDYLPRVKIIIISSDRSRERRLELESLGIDAYLTKAFTPEGVRQSLQGATIRIQRRQETNP